MENHARRRFTIISYPLFIGDKEVISVNKISC